MADNNHQHGDESAPPAYQRNNLNHIYHDNQDGDAANYWPEIVPHFEEYPNYLEWNAQCGTCMRPLTIMDREGPAMDRGDIEETCGPVAILPCGHIMGLPCLNAWIEGNRDNETCPVCRASLRHPRCRHMASLGRLWPGTSELTQRVRPDVELPSLCPICRLIDTFRRRISTMTSDRYHGAMISFDLAAYSHVIDETVARPFRLCFGYRRSGEADNEDLDGESEDANGQNLRRGVQAALDEYNREGATVYQPGEMIVRVRHFENILRDGDVSDDPTGMLYGGFFPVMTYTADTNLADYRHPLLDFDPDVLARRARQSHRRDEYRRHHSHGNSSSDVSIRRSRRNRRSPSLGSDYRYGSLDVARRVGSPDFAYSIRSQVASYLARSSATTRRTRSPEGGRRATSDTDQTPTHRRQGNLDTDSEDDGAGSGTHDNRILRWPRLEEIRLRYGVDDRQRSSRGRRGREDSQRLHGSRRR